MKLRILLVVLLISVALLITQNTTSGPVLPATQQGLFGPRRVPHAHPDNVTGLAAAHADRFTGMLHASQCQVPEAIEYFTHAILHDNSDEEIKQAAPQAGRYLAGMSNTLLSLAIAEERNLEATESKADKSFTSSIVYRSLLDDVKRKYTWAFKCNEHNEAAMNGLLRIFSKEEKLKQY